MKTWQRLVGRWTELVFRDRFAEVTPRIRVMRLLEEALELAQAEDVPVTDAIIILNQVYDRPKGEPSQELGGVVITLANYAETAGLDLEEAFYSEFTRIMDPAIMEKVRKRNLDGDKIGFAKPGNNDKGFIRFTGTMCSICDCRQFHTPSGVTCPNGHGGVPEAEDICARGRSCVCTDPSPNTCNAFKNPTANPAYR
jgi:NTP pyrophosphatase (non-canonical NTP hydrolase)